MSRGRTFSVHLWVNCSGCGKEFRDEDYRNLDDGGGIMVFIPPHKCRKDAARKHERTLREIRKEHKL